MRYLAALSIMALALLLTGCGVGKEGNEGNKDCKCAPCRCVDCKCVAGEKCVCPGCQEP